MNKRGWIGIILIGILIILLVIAAAMYYVNFSLDKKNEVKEANETPPLPPTPTPTPTPTPEIQNTTPNITTPIDTGNVPNPTGIISFNSIRDDSAEYTCNRSAGTKHKIKIYTYRILSGEKKLSDNFIESPPVDNICLQYDDITNSSTNVYYYLKWSWTGVSGIDGYRILQYYHWGNTTRDYDYFIEVGKNAVELNDMNLDLWKPVSN